MINFVKNDCKKINFTEWLKENRFNTVSLAKYITEKGEPLSHTAIWYWRKGINKPKNVKVLNILSELAGFRAEKFFLTDSQEKRLTELSEKYKIDEAFEFLFPYLK